MTMLSNERVAVNEQPAGDWRKTEKSFVHRAVSYTRTKYVDQSCISCTRKYIVYMYV